jgi:hypothetical protein
MSEGSERARQRLGQLVLARRKELGLSVREAARRAGVMRPTWTGLEQGSRRTADYNFAAMERTLDWRPGSFESVLGGGEPTPAGPPAADPDASPVGPPTTAHPPDKRRYDPPDRDTPDPDTPTKKPGAVPPVGAPAAHSAVRWSDIVDVLDTHLGGIGQATAVDGTQRLWGAEQITALARRLRPQQVSRGGVVMVGWSDVVSALEAAIAAIRQDTSMSSEARLWGVEMVVDVAGELRAAQRVFQPVD